MQNNREDVYEIQNYLRAIQLANNESALLNPDGIYGSETVEAVIEYQIKNSIPATGRVDSFTWDSIYRDYNIAKENLSAPEKVSFFPLGVYELKKGDDYDEIYVLQALIRTYDKRLGNPQPLVITGVFDENTERAVKEIQRIFDLPQTGTVNKSLWNKMAKFHNDRYFSERY
ncbi:MAG: peptidoglycan-binding protein [Ruminococcaceae bacterium]|nr:peptidoglycan-binding protein [Oscillospiraceae bacterium]